jgi:hypothetical protein
MRRIDPLFLLAVLAGSLPVRSLCNKIGGSVVAGLSGEVDVIVNDEQATFRFRNIDGTGYVLFTDLNRLLGYTYGFGGDALRLHS